MLYVPTHVTSSAASSDSAVKLMTDSYQFWVAHFNLRVTFQSHIWFARKVQKCGDAFSKSSSIHLCLHVSDFLTSFQVICREEEERGGWMRRRESIIKDQVTNDNV